MMFKMISGAVLLAGVVYLRYRRTAVRNREKRRR
jgi:hypothetical protein